MRASRPRSQNACLKKSEASFCEAKNLSDRHFSFHSPNTCCRNEVSTFSLSKPAIMITNCESCGSCGH